MIWILGYVHVSEVAREESALDDMSARERWAPWRARRCVVARPMPEAAPVRAMTLPWSEAIGKVEKESSVSSDDGAWARK